jgi:hypothetical protein
VKATPECKNAFLQERKLVLVPPSSANSFRSITHSDDAPDWFAPESVELYDTWDAPGYHGSVWINKTTGHIFFWDAQL